MNQARRPTHYGTNRRQTGSLRSEGRVVVGLMEFRRVINKFELFENNAVNAAANNLVAFTPLSSLD